jgi:hypothetical protein
MESNFSNIVITQSPKIKNNNQISRILGEDSGFDLIETWKDQRLRKLEDYTNHFTFDTSEPLRT